MLTYRRWWHRTTTVVVAVGCGVLLWAWCAASTLTFAFAVTAGLVAFHVRRADVAGKDRARLRQLAPDSLLPWERRVLLATPAFVVATIGWTVAIGQNGVPVVLANAALGVPLLFRPDDEPAVDAEPASSPEVG